MFGERRKHQRTVINRVARVQADSGLVSTECTITDISDRGARLFVADLQLPQRFFLHIAADRPVRHECRLAWRLGGEAGVEFCSATDHRHTEVVNRLKAEARQIFQSTASPSG